MTEGRDWLGMTRADFDTDVEEALFDMAPVKTQPDGDGCGTIDMAELLGEGSS